jgi:hypothetical protein
LWEEGIGSREKYLETSGIDDGVWVIYVFVYFWLPILCAESFRDTHSFLIALAQDNLQYVYTEASARLLATALRQINSMVCEQGASLFPFSLLLCLQRKMTVHVDACKELFSVCHDFLGKL